MELASNEVLVVHVYSTSVTKEEGSVECQHAEISDIFRLKGGVEVNVKHMLLQW